MSREKQMKFNVGTFTVEFNAGILCYKNSSVSLSKRRLKKPLNRMELRLS